MTMAKIIKGDCFRVLDEGIHADLGRSIIVTDPPFNIRYHYHEYMDSLKPDEYMKNLSHLFDFGIPVVMVNYPETLYRLSAITGQVPERVVSWVYPSNTGRQHRDIAFYGISPDFRKVTQPYKNPNDKRIRKLIEKGSTGSRIYDWWQVNQVKNVSREKTGHPCQMPLEVMTNIIGILPDDAIIIDPYAGSGTTLVAAERMGRESIGIEIDETYVDIITERLKKEDEKDR